MATAAQTQATLTAPDPVQRRLQGRAATNHGNGANRRNSLHSTGPRTESGKQRSSLNALTHGLTARTAVLPFAQDSNPQVLIPLPAKLGLHGSHLSRQFQKALQQLREIQEERRRLERRQLIEAAELLLLHEHKGLPWDHAAFSEESGFVFSPEQIERQAKKLVRQNPVFYAPHARLQADPLL